MVSAVKELALELGRTPKRTELEGRIKGGRYKLDHSSFGNFTALLHAAGLETYHSPKITNAIFERPIERHLQEYTPKVVKTPAQWPAVACLSDVHLPFANHRVLDAFIEYVSDAKPEWIVLAGDIWDFLSHSKFPRSHNVFSPEEERQACIRLNTELWAKLKAGSPRSACYQLAGNHEARPLKRVLEEYPAAESWIREMLMRDLSFPGVTTMLDPRDYLSIGESIIVMHGFKTQPGSHKDMALTNVISGHSHVGSVTFRRLMDRTIWELGCGFAGDPEAKGLTYTPSKITAWTPGFGVVDRLGPRFVPV